VASSDAARAAGIQLAAMTTKMRPAGTRRKETQSDVAPNETAPSAL
jgi:hypothetical protein